MTQTVHAIVRTDLMQGTIDGSSLVSLRYMGSGSTATQIDNGNVVVVEDLLDNERELYKGVTPTAGADFNKLVLVATPENMTDERKKNLNEFVNEAGADARGYRLRHGNIFSVTAEALDGTPAKGNIVEAQAGTKLKAVSAGTEDSTAIGKIIEVDVVGSDTFYVIRID